MTLTILNKLIRLIVVDQHLRLRLGIFIIFVVVVTLQLGTIQLQKKQLSQIKIEKEMIAHIPDMERKSMMSASARLQAQAAKGGFVLKGTSTKEGAPYAVIDETVYKVGDIISGYTVVEITENSVALENMATKDIRSLRF